MTSVSVALCTRNGASFIEQQLRSILEQSHAVDEIVLSDDASTDETIDIAEKIINNYEKGPNIKFIQNTSPLGVTANFAKALTEASGDFIVLSDQDDVWSPDRIATALIEFEENPSVSLVAGDAKLIDAGGEYLPRTLFQTLGITQQMIGNLNTNPLAELLRRNLLTGATMVVRRELIVKALPFPASWVHDEWLAVVTAVTSTIKVITKPVIQYRQHSANQIGVNELTFSGKLGRLRSPRTERNARLLARAMEFSDRITQLTQDQLVIDHAREKLAHEQKRSMLPAQYILRAIPVAQEFFTGRYSRYGLGAQDVLRDLVQSV